MSAASPNLMNEVVQWMDRNNFRHASFERLTSVVPSAGTFDELNEMIASYPNIFRACYMKGHMPGLAFVDGYTPGNFGTPLTITDTQPVYQVQARGYEIPFLTGTPNINMGVGIEDGNVRVSTQPATPPKVTEADVMNEIVSEHFINVGQALADTDALQNPLNRPVVIPNSLNLLTICILVLRNGYTVTGKSACVSPALYDKAKGEEMARKKAIEQIWPLLGFRLADKLAQ